MKFLIFSALLNLFIPFNLFSQNYWQKADIGNEGGIINVLYSDTINQVLYAGSDGKGIFATTNTGASWIDKTSNLPTKELNVRSITKAGNDLILGAFYFTYSEGAYCSTDNETSWTDITTSLSGSSIKIDKK